MDPEALERRLDLLEHRRHRIALERGELGDVRALVAVLGRLLPAPDRLDRGPEALHLRAGVVVVVLALDRVAGVREDARDRVAVGAVPGRRDRDRPGRVRGDHLDLHALDRVARTRRRSARPPRESPPSASPYQAGASQRLTKPGPGDLGALDELERRRLLRRAPPRSRAAARFRSGASWSAAFVAKSPCSGLAGRSSATGPPARQRCLELLDRSSRQRSREARRALRATAARRELPAAIITSPASSTASGSGVVSNVPSSLRSATITAPVSCRMRRSRIVLPGLAARRRDLDLLVLEVAAARAR